MKDFSWTGPTDVLLKIFSFLEVDDLTLCETVCRDWQDGLCYDKTWKLALQRKIDDDKDSQRFWNRLHQRGELDGLTFREQCEFLSVDFRLRVRNSWRSGKFASNVHLFGPDAMRHCSQFDCMMADHLFLIDPQNISKFNVVSGTFESEIPLDGYCRCVRSYGNLLFCGVNGFIEVYDTTNWSKVDQLKMSDGGFVDQMFFDSRNRLVAFSFGAHQLPTLIVWQMDEKKQFSLLFEEVFGFFRERIVRVEIDDKFVAIAARTTRRMKIHFISTETWLPVYSRRVKRNEFCYTSGLLFTVKGSVISILDVASEKRLGCIAKTLAEQPDRPVTELQIRTNSEWLVLLTQEQEPALAIYSIADIKKLNASQLKPITTIELPGQEVSRLLVSETEIAVMSQLVEEVRIISFF